MARAMKCLLCKREDTISELTFLRNQGANGTGPREMEIDRFWGSSVSQCNPIGEPRRNPVSKMVNGIPEDDSQCYLLAFVMPKINL